MEKKLPNISHIKSLTKLMDSQFKVPGTRWRFGLDPILGLIPGAGDIISYGISGLIIYYISRYGASRKVIVMMVGNAALDAVIGSIPVIGQLFDFAFKANERNLRLLSEHYEEGKHYGSGKRYIFFFIIIFLIVFALIFAAAFALIAWIVSLF